MVKIMENPIKMDDLGVPLFLETPIFQNGRWILPKRGPMQRRGQVQLQGKKQLEMGPGPLVKRFSDIYYLHGVFFETRHLIVYWMIN